MKELKKLEKNKSDLIASVTKSVVGAIPFAGTFLSELVSTVIPNQRIDRLTKYIEILEKKISDIPRQIIIELKSNEEFIDLLEESFIQASRAITDIRREYIASLLVNGINNKSIEIEESKFLIKILQELNDVEIIWLRYYLIDSIGEDEPFRKKHENILKRIRVYVGADEETRKKAAIQDNYTAHLERLGLISKRIRINRQTNLPEFNKLTGQTEFSGIRTTELGKILLKQIGLNNHTE